MIFTLFKKIFGSQNERHLKQMGKSVIQINSLEKNIALLTDEQLHNKTIEFKKRIKSGTTLDTILPEAFAVCREASQRVLKMRHFDVQLIGGITLHEGRISEMRTGEGKTLIATLAAYLNALAGQGVHIITVNDYLATRDAQWMGPLYHFLGLTVGIVISSNTSEEKKIAYQADITYGTNNEFGFDYLRDNMAFRLEDQLQRGQNYAIVDEVDSILIDEARTPLIISGPTNNTSDLYIKINEMIPELTRQIAQEEQIEKEGHYTIDEKNRQIDLTELGHQHIEKLMVKHGLISETDNLYSSQHLNLLHHVTSGLKAHYLFQKDVEYIIDSTNQGILLIDEHTGRTMPGRRLSDGLHQAIEAKERLPVQQETQTLASTTFQNYFRLYNKLSGMTGTAYTEAYEMHQIYNLDVVVIPTHLPVKRDDAHDLVFLTLAEKYKEIIQDITACVKKNQPVLVGTASVESSELLSTALKKANIKHEVLNAKFHSREADIIAQAGRPGAITIATNMAGRGTDIILGGNWGAEVSALKNPTDKKIQAIQTEWKKRNAIVLAAGGLHVIGTERHESRRIDNQLRGRSGRQGDPGSSRFYLSLDDNLMRIFVSDRIKLFMQSMDSEDGPIESKMVSNAIEKAQRKVEGHNFDIRKQLLEYDDVANAQRLIVYQQRNEILQAENVKNNIQNMRKEVVYDFINQYLTSTTNEEWNIAGLENTLHQIFNIKLPIQKWCDDNKTIDPTDIMNNILDCLLAIYQKNEELTTPEAFRDFEKHILLRILDEKWKEHLSLMDHLRQGIHLRGYASRNPKDEYKREAYNLFESLLNHIRHDVIKKLSHVQIQTPEESEAETNQRYHDMIKNIELHHEKTPKPAIDVLKKSETATRKEPFIRQNKKVGRNEVCFCGSGKKYKQCHGRL
ncbi:MAG: preprotein translocase subunit SecA [Endozoicomonadaceae bacterium]|nr:preprotein translocase subunit SecA [Endozoicomonadaceae bacterium]